MSSSYEIKSNCSIVYQRHMTNCDFMLINRVLMHKLCLIDSSLLSTNIQSINQIQQLVTKHTVYLITHDCISKGNLCTYIKNQHEIAQIP
jgi:hypothetical protein